MPAAPTHREHLTVPVSWWLVGLAFGLTFVIAIAAYTNLWFGAATAVAVTTLIGVVLWSWGHVLVAADQSGFTAGTAHVEWPWVAHVEALDAKEVTDALGPGANAAGHFVTRPYARGAVRLTLQDPADPHPFWLVSTRHPAQLAATVAAQLAATRSAAQ